MSIKLSKVHLVIAGTVVAALIVGSGLIGHFAFPYETSSGEPTATPETTTTTPEPENDIDYRLPTSLAPTHYRVELRPFVRGNFSIHGRVEIEIDVLEATSNVTIHLADIVTHNDTIKVTRADQELAIIEHSYDPIREFYVGHLEESLKEGEKIILEMEFEGYLNDQMRGFYRASYADENGNQVYVAGTQFQPTDARRAFPCFDEPALKAKFTVSLAREKTMTTLSNMELEDSVPFDDDEDWVWDHYNTTVDMSSYLVAFVVSDFESKSDVTDDGKPFSVWARKAAIEGGQADYALGLGPKVQDFFADYFNISYVLPKQDMVAITDFSAGAMENWGLIIYRESAMLYDNIVSSASDLQWVGLVIVHELAHQWFGNLVSPSWWEDLWLNEGFATYMEYVGLEHTEPNWNTLDQFLVTDLHKAMAIDSLENSHALRFPVASPSEIYEIFDIITYSKGASIIRMMNHFLTEENFKQGLTEYLNAFSYKAATQDDLWQKLTENSDLGLDVTVKDIMDTWTLQMGYPVLTVERQADGQTFSVSQKRFLLVGNASSTEEDSYMWWIPVSYTTSNEVNFDQTAPDLWLNNTEKEKTFTIDSINADSWVLFNVKETGYYRVNYDSENWGLLDTALKSGHTAIHISSRAQLLDDALTLARGGQLDYNIALSLTLYMVNEAEYVPWQALKTNFGYLEKMLAHTAGYDDLQNYIWKLLEPLYTTMTFNQGPSDLHLDHFKRTLAVSWACQYGRGNCPSEAASAYNDWITSDIPIDANIKTSVLCTAIAQGSRDDWDAAFERYKRSDVAAEKDQILRALGCSQDLWDLYRYLEWTFTEEYGIRKQDARTAFRSVAANTNGNPLAWSYLMANWQHIYEYFTSFSTLGELIASTAAEFNTVDQLNQLEKFYEDNKAQLGTATMAIGQAIETTKNNVAWMDNNYEVIREWLRNNIV